MFSSFSFLLLQLLSHRTYVWYIRKILNSKLSILFLRWEYDEFFVLFKSFGSNVHTITKVMPPFCIEKVLYIFECSQILPDYRESNFLCVSRCEGDTSFETNCYNLAASLFTKMILSQYFLWPSFLEIPVGFNVINRAQHQFHHKSNSCEQLGLRQIHHTNLDLENLPIYDFYNKS